MRKVAAHYVFPVSAPPIRNGLVTLSDEGEILSLGEMQEEEEGVEFYSGVLIPGFVNAHCHLELSHLLGEMPEGLGLSQFLAGVVRLRQKKSQEEVYRAISLADEQMHAQGTVAVGDISNSGISFDVKAQSPISYHTFIEVLELWSERVGDLLRDAELLRSRAQEKKLSASLTAHAPYSTSAAMLAALAQKSSRMSVHNQECADENLFFEQGRGALRDFFSTIALLPQKTGKTSIHHTLENVANVENLLLVHNTCTSAADYDFAASCSKNISWVLCPRSNLYIEGALPPVRMLRTKGADMALGTDSLSSNHSLSLLDELKCVAQNFPDIPFTEMLHWATLGGAKALGCEGVFGSLERGKRSGVVLLENFDFNRFTISSATTSRLLTKKC